MRPKLEPGVIVAGIGLKRYAQWLPTLGIWGATAGISVLFFFERVPLLRKDIFQNLPMFGDHWKRMLNEPNP